MYNRYGADLRANPRDRSPSRPGDRRSSISYPSPGQPPSRPLDDANSPPLGREPPRGPKALVDVPRASTYMPTGPRGRGGYPSRSDYRDRERERDFRDQPVHRRDSDRDRLRWGDRDFDRDRTSYRGGRSRSPPVRDFGHARDTTRRDSLGGLLTPGFDSSAGGLSSATRGGAPLRGRGRSDWDRGRGRGTLFDDRDVFRRRSRSREREGWRDRDISRDRDRDPDYRDRREDEKKAEREERERESLSWKRPASRNDSRNPSGSTNPSTPLPQSAHSSHPPSIERSSGKDAFDATRKPSSSITPLAAPRETRRDADKADPFSSRPESSRLQSRASSPPPSGPQVPAFGSLPILTPTSASLAGPTGITPKPPPASAATIKPETRDDAAPTVIRPPTGPKADREAAQQFGPSGQWGRQDGPIRPAQAPPSAPSKAPESAPTGPVPSMVAREQESQSHGESRPYGSSVPTQSATPFSSSSALPFGKPPGTIGSALSPTSQTTTPTRPASMNTSLSSDAALAQGIPTGPRQSRLSRPLVPTGPKPNQWVSPAYRKPSLMAQMPKSHYGEKRDALNADTTSGSPTAKHHPQPERRLTLLPAKHETPEDVSVTDAEDTKTRDESNEPESTRHDRSRIPDSLGQSSEEDDEEDEGLGLDEDDVERAERSYQKQREALAAKKPPSPLKDPIIVGLLLRIQLLGMIANDDIPDELRGAPIPEEEEPAPLPAIPPTGLPSPSADEEEQRKAAEPERRPLKEIPIHKPPTPPPDSLMFLKSSPHTPLSDISTLDESLEKHGQLKNALLLRLAEQREEILDFEDDLRDEWTEHFRRHRAAVEMMDRIKREENPTPAPATPEPIAAAPPTIPLVEVGRRSGMANKFTTELDFQNILKASEQSAREEQERRDRQESAKPDYEKEAVIPDMLNDHDREAWIFQDRNHLIPQDKVLEVFEFVPPKDDFTEEEERTFLEQFLIYPKKWGKIAEAIPDRDYQQCIQHYYLTKEQHGYKIKLQKRWQKRGRRVKQATTAKSQALMADLGARNTDLYDGGEFAPSAVTDTGRPRRAAAPTFGESGPDTENSTPAPTSSKRAAKEQNGEVATEKPTRGRKAGAGSRGGRRPKVPQQPPALAVAPGPSPPKVVRELGISAPKDELRPQEQWEPKVVEEPRQPYPAEQEAWREHGNEYAFSRPSESDASSMVRTQAAPPSSYWSVPEQRAFPSYVNHFGTDFEAIATHMGTKTTIMVKNHYQRCVSHKEKKTISGVIVGPELEAIALEAEARAKRGEPPMPLPEQPVAPKRRYDTTSTSLPQRPLAPSVEPMDVEETAVPSLAKSVQAQQASPPPHAALPRSALVDATTKQRYQPLGLRAPEQSAATQRPGDDQLRTIRPQVSQQQRQSSGPKIGYFAEGPTESRPTNQPVSSISRPGEQAVQQQQQQQAPTPQIPAHHLDSTRHDQALQEQQNLAHQRVGGAMPDSKPVQPQYQHSPPLGPQQHYISQQSSAHQSSAPFGHSRHLSSTVTGSPAQPVLKQEPDMQPLRHIDQYSGPKPYAPSPKQSPMLGRQQVPLSPRRDPTTLAPAGLAHTPAATPAPPPAPTQEAPRAAPAKRSNIMSILNDEPPEPAPKRVSSEQAPPTGPTPYASSPRHQLYHQMRQPPEPQHPAAPSRHDSPPHVLYHQPHQQQQQQQQQQYQAPLRREEGPGAFADSHLARSRSLYGEPALSQEGNSHLDRLREQGQTPRLETTQSSHGYQPYRSSYEATGPQSQTHPPPQSQQPPSRSYAEYNSSFSGPSPSGLGNSDWIKRLDPRQQHHGPPTHTPDHFSRGPTGPGSQYGNASATLTAAQQQSVPPPPYTRQHQVHPGPAANPSPPPPPQPQPGQMYRSSSVTSQHARIPSHGHTSSLHTQSPIGPPPSSAGYPHSAATAPGPPLQRQPSGGYDPRPPSQPQQHPVYDQRHQQQPQQIPPPQHMQPQPQRPGSANVYGPPPPAAARPPPGQPPPPGPMYPHHRHAHHRHYSHESDRR